MSAGNGNGVVTVPQNRVFQQEPSGNYRVPPHSVVAEMGALSSMLVEPHTAIPQCIGRITPVHFFIPGHQVICTALFDMFEKRSTIDLITLGQWLDDRQQLEAVGGHVFIAELQIFVSFATNLPSYIETLREKFIAREVIRNFTEGIRIAYDEQLAVNVMLDQVQSSVTALSMETTSEESLRHIGPGVDRALEQLENAHANKGEEVVDGLATGFYDLDRMICGMKPQQLITIAGLTSHGKSAAAINIAEHVAMKLGKAVGIWSMEMSYEEQSQRLVCSVADVSLQRFRDGFLKDLAWKEIPERVAPLKRAPIYIDDTRGMSLNEMRAAGRRAVTKKQLELIIIDFGQLMSAQSRQAQDNRAREIDAIWAGLKSLAKELRIPVIVLSQFNRDASKRNTALVRPKLSDLKESSGIEQHSDVVIAVWRPGMSIADGDKDAQQAMEKRMGLEKLNEKCRIAWMKLEEIDGEPKSFVPLTWKNYAELIVLKQRNGPARESSVRYEGDVTRFENVTPKMWSNNPQERQQ